LIERVKSCVGLERLRVARPDGQQRPIRRIGLTWGGMGLFVNVAFQQELLEQGCDLFIAGEADSYAFRFATEAGVAVIETSHEASEQAGLRRFTEMLQAAFADVRFVFEEMPTAWEIC
jgi:putative NIF3 family GTP cyclohydrolase 1 type 2